MRRRLPASASDASREALNSSEQREAPPLPPDLPNQRGTRVAVAPIANVNIEQAKYGAAPKPNMPGPIEVDTEPGEYTEIRPRVARSTPLAQSWPS
jgi:hypothetical protein